MNLKNHSHSPYHLQLESLVGRASPQKIEKPLYQERSGYYGERALDYPLKKVQFPHFTTHHVRLENDQLGFQMDSVLWTPRYDLIIEAKDYTGHLTFNEGFNQIIQRKLVAGKEEINVYDDPVLQVEEQKLQLELWLEAEGQIAPPIETLVVMTNPRAYLEAPKDSIYQQKVIPLSKLPSKLREIDQNYQKEYLSLTQTRNLAKFVASRHTPWKPDVFKRLGLNPNDVKRGVRCPSCRRLPMLWRRLRFECRHCGLRSSDAFMDALKEFYLLYGDQITNRQFRWFTGVSSERTAYEMLKRANLPKIGNYKKSSYKLDFNFDKDYHGLIVQPARKFLKPADIF